MWFFKYINRLLATGVTSSLSSDQIKTVRLLNAGCITWIPLNFMFIVEDTVLNPEPFNNILTFAFTALILFVILGLQSVEKYSSARMVFLLLSLVHFMAFAIFLEPGSFIEYFLLLIPIFTLIFFNNVIWSFVAFALSFICFTFTIIWFNNYPNLEFQHFANFALFFSVYLSFVYLKRLNIANEKLLEQQKNEAVRTGRQIEKQKLELEELNRFQAHFWVNLSHELRTPLTLIKGSSNQLMSYSKDETSEVTRHYKRIDDNADKIRVLVDNIMDLAKMRANKLEMNYRSVDINEFCTKIITSFEPLFTQKNIQYSISNLECIVVCQIDKLYLERALSNVLLNAYKFTKKNGRVKLNLELIENHVEISVVDNGKGIASEEINNIFNPFYRAKDSSQDSEGTGIGLSFTKEVMELHNGNIYVDSTEGKGSTFRLTLPLAKKQNLPLASPISEPRNSWDSKKATHILLVDDNCEMRAYIKEVLSKVENNIVHESINGIDAIESINIFSNLDLIITDYMMPEMNGYEFIKAIRAKGIEVPVIVLTARVDLEAKLDFLRLGIDDYLTKPFNEEELLIRIQHSIMNNNERIQFKKEASISDLFVDNDTLDVKELVESNMKSSTFSVTELADLLSLTERTLHRKIKSLSGLTPNGFIREVKLQRAKILYDSGKVTSIKELAYEVGFVNTGHLSKLFEERFGIKPEFTSELIMKI